MTNTVYHCTTHAVFTRRRATQTNSVTYFRHIPELRDEMTCPFETCLPLCIWVKSVEQMSTINLTEVAAYGVALWSIRDPSQQFGEAEDQVSQEQPSAEKHSSWRLQIIQMHRFEAEEAPTTKHKQRSNHFRASLRCDPVPHLCTDGRLGLEHKEKILKDLKRGMLQEYVLCICPISCNMFDLVLVWYVPIQ